MAKPQVRQVILVRCPGLMLVGMLLVGIATASAAVAPPSIVVVSGSANLGADDFVEWGQRPGGRSGYPINASVALPELKLLSNKGKSVTVTGWASYGVHETTNAPDGTPGIHFPKGFGIPDGLIMLDNPEMKKDSPPLRIAIADPVKGVAAQFIPAWAGSSIYTDVTLRAFGDAGGVLGVFKGRATREHPVIYIGALSTTTNIKQVEISAETLSGGKHQVSNVFYIGRLDIVSAPQAPAGGKESVPVPPAAQSPSQPVPRVAAVSQGRVEVKIGRVLYTLSTDKVEYGPDDPVELKFTITNAGRSSARFEFASTQQHDFLVLKGATQIMRWSSGQTFSKANQTLTVAPGGALTYTTRWLQKEPNQQTLSAGEYQLKAVFVLKDGPVEVSLAFRRLAQDIPSSSVPPVQPSPPPPASAPSAAATPSAPPPSPSPPAAVTPAVQSTAAPIAPPHVFGLSKQYSEARKGDIVYTLSSDKVEYAAKEAVDLTFKITNVGTDDAKFTFASAEQYDFIVRRGATDIARWSSGKTLSPGSPDVVLGPGKSLVFQSRWPQEDMHRQTITPGQYEIAAIFLAKDSEVAVTLGFQRVR